MNDLDANLDDRDGGAFSPGGQLDAGAVGPPRREGLLDREPVIVSALVVAFLLAGLEGLDVWLLGDEWRVAVSTSLRQVIAVLGAGFAARGLVTSPATLRREYLSRDAVGR